MSSDAVLALCLLALLALAAGVLRAAGVPDLARAPVLAVLRAGGQLAVVALLLAAAFADARVAAAFVVVMLAAVAVTSGRRLGGGRRVAQVLLASAAGTAPVLAVLLLPGAFPRTPRYAISFGGIVLGGTMTVCTLAGRRLRDVTADRWDQVEGWLALGATARQAVTPFVPAAVREALLPALDQTRTTGLVTLPGAFVGSLAGGASPADAARFQLAVLSGILAAQAVAAVVLLRLLAPSLAVAPERPG